MEASNKLSQIHNQIISRYSEPVKITEGVYHRVDKEVKQLTSYMLSEYTNDNTAAQDEQAIKSPFMNQFTQVRNFEYTTTAIKRKHIEGYSIDEDYVFSMIVEKEVQEEFDNLVISNFLKDLIEGEIDYGTALVMVTDCDNEIGYKLEVPDFSTAYVDPFNIDGGAKMFPHELDFMELEAKRGVWNDESIDALIEFAESEEDQTVEVHHIEGLFKECDITGYPDDDTSYAYYEIYMGIAGDEKFYLDHNKLDQKRVYAFNREDRKGNKAGQGMGALEEVKPEQIWINDIAISMQESIQLSSKVGVKTNKQGLPTVFDVENGFHVELEEGEYYDSFTYQMPQVNYMAYMNLYIDNLRKKTSMHEGITGEEQKAGTPYAGQALQTKQAASRPNYLREKYGQQVIWILNNLILPRMVKRINKDHVLNAAYSPRERAIIDQAIVNRGLIDHMLNGFLLPEELLAKKAELEARQAKKGDRRSVHVPQGYITMDKINTKMRWHITSDTDDVQTKINNLVSQMSSLDPQDPARMMMMNEVMELSGQSPAQFRPQSSTGTPQLPGGSNLENQLDSVTPEAQN